MNNFKLVKDFGVSALWGTIVIGGVVFILVNAMITGRVAEAEKLSVLGLALITKVFDIYMQKRKDDKNGNGHNGNGG